MQEIRLWIRKYFAFSQRETSAFLLLLALMVLVLAVPFFYKPTAEPYNTEKDRQLLDSLTAALDNSAPDKTFHTYAEPKESIALHPFNPNKLTVQEWEKFGLKKYLAERILKYRSKAGDFKYKSQLQN